MTYFPESLYRLMATTFLVSAAGLVEQYRAQSAISRRRFANKSPGVDTLAPPRCRWCGALARASSEFVNVMPERLRGLGAAHCAGNALFCGDYKPYRIIE